MKKFLSLSYGVESTAMAILYGKGATCIFCDTGAEPKQIYERIAKVDKILKEIHGGDIELVKIKASVRSYSKPLLLSYACKILIKFLCVL